MYFQQKVDTGGLGPIVYATGDLSSGLQQLSTAGAYTGVEGNDVLLSSWNFSQTSKQHPVNPVSDNK